MTGRPLLRPICLIGPPAAGKTTLAERLSRGLHAPTIRPRDLINRAVGRHPALIGLFSRDDRGRVPDESLGFALRVCLDSLEGLVILESLPWDVIQLADLSRVADQEVVVLYLHASDDLVTERRVGRQYCGSCYPSPPSSDDGKHCGRCGSPLTARADDELAAFQERLQLHRANAAKILTFALKLEIPVITLAAVDPADDLATHALAAINAG